MPDNKQAEEAARIRKGFTELFNDRLRRTCKALHKENKELNTAASLHSAELERVRKENEELKSTIANLEKLLDEWNGH